MTRAILGRKTRSVSCHFRYSRRIRGHGALPSGSESLASREPISELWKKGRDPLPGFRILRLGLNPERNALYTRINERARRMFDNGLVEETKRLLEKHPGAWALSSLGYKQAAQYLRGEIDLKLAIWAAQQAHRNYAKRQMTWFRREPEVEWMKGFGDEEGVQERAISEVSNQFGN